MKFYTKLFSYIIHIIIQKNLYTIIYFAYISIFKMKSDVMFGENHEKSTKNSQNDVTIYSYIVNINILCSYDRFTSCVKISAQLKHFSRFYYHFKMKIDAKSALIN